MKNLLLIVVATVGLSACVAPTTLICDREAQEWNKFDTAEDVCDVVRGVTIVVDRDDKNDRPDKPKRPKDDPKDDPEGDDPKDDPEGDDPKDDPEGDDNKDNASEHNGKGGNDGKGGKDRDGSKNSDKGRT
jgi:hypothetical protein